MQCQELNKHATYHGTKLMYDKLMINCTGTLINADVSSKNLLINVNVIMSLYGILVRV